MLDILLRWPRLVESICNGVASVRLSVCPFGILTATHHGTACDAASVYFGLAYLLFCICLEDVKVVTPTGMHTVSGRKVPLYFCP